MGQTTISVEAEIEIGLLKNRVPAVLREIGTGGARLTLGDRIGRRGDLIELYLPAPGGVISILAEVVRASSLPPVRELEVTFAAVEQEHQKQLDDLLKLLLAGDGGGARAAPRLALDLEVGIGEGAERGHLVDLSRGGLGVTLTRPIKVGQPLTVRLPLTTGELELRGKVVNVRLAPVPGGVAYRAGVAFDQLDKHTRGRLDELLELLLTES
jgi:hypothetical protein